MIYMDAKVDMIWVYVQIVEAKISSFQSLSLFIVGVVVLFLPIGRH